MGFSLSWLAIKGKSPQALREELKFRPTGARDPIPECDLAAIELPNGWYLIVDQRSEQVVADDVLRQLSADGCELVTCFVEEHVMVSAATGWRDGRMKWSIIHDAQKSRRHLEVEGEPPAEFAAIRDRCFAEDEEDCDHVFSVPVKTAESIAGYIYDEDNPALVGMTFEVLEREARPRKLSLWSRIFGK